jgi:hypothetical protein
MPFKNLEDVLKIDPRFIGICAVRDGMPVQMELADSCALPNSSRT